MKHTAHTDRFVFDNLPPLKDWPELIFELDELQFPERLNATVALLDQAVAEGDGDRVAIIGSPFRWTYRDLQAQVNRLARVLVQDMQLQPGNRVLLRGFNSPWLAAAWLAVWKAGGVAVGTMPLFRAMELKTVLKLAQVSHALCQETLIAELDAAAQECPELQHIGRYGSEAFDALVASKVPEFEAVDTASDDPALIAFTSGTTGVPKGCVHFHRDVMAMCEGFPRYCLKPERDDIFIGTPPLAFTFGLGGLLCFPLHARASTVLLEKLTPEHMLAAIETYGVTISITSPTAYGQMSRMATNFNLSTLKKSVSAGEALPLPTRKLWREVSGIQIHDGIGGTEMIHIYLASSPETYREGALGKPLPGYHAMLVDQHMNPVPEGQMGWLAVKGPVGCRYLADARQKKYVRNGWNITGDTYHCDADGFYYYHARVDDIIVTSGYNVSSPEVEMVLLGHPAVAECGVIGVPDSERGQVLKAFIVLKPGHEPSDVMTKALQDHVKQNAAPYKYPRLISYLDGLPRTETGKLQRYRLKTLT